MRFKWPTRQWYNWGSPEHLRCRLTHICGQFNASVYERWRVSGHAVASRLNVPSARYRSLIEYEWQTFNPAGRVTLGLHMRGTDKASGRKSVTPAAFQPYVRAFLADFPDGKIFVATESAIFTAEVATKWGEETQHSLYVRNISTRSRRVANFRFYTDKLSVAHDVMLDIHLLSRCDYLLHGASAVAEAAIYQSPNARLHWNSTDLEYSHRCKSATDCPDAPWRWAYPASAAHVRVSGKDSSWHQSASSRRRSGRIGNAKKVEASGGDAESGVESLPR